MAAIDEPAKLTKAGFPRHLPLTLEPPGACCWLKRQRLTARKANGTRRAGTKAKGAARQGSNQALAPVRRRMVNLDFSQIPYHDPYAYLFALSILYHRYFRAIVKAMPRPKDADTSWYRWVFRSLHLMMQIEDERGPFSQIGVPIVAQNRPATNRDVS